MPEGEKEETMNDVLQKEGEKIQKALEPSIIAQESLKKQTEEMDETLKEIMKHEAKKEIQPEFQTELLNEINKKLEEQHKEEIKHIIITVILTVVATKFFDLINWSKVQEAPNIIAYFAQLGLMFLFYILLISALAYALLKIIKRIEF